MNEAQYQRKLIKKIKDRLPGCLVLKNDPSQIQGLPDLLILHEDRWGMLEVKRSPDEDVQPNQEHYVSGLNEMSFASFIDPESEEEVLGELQRSFRTPREARISKP